MTKKAEPNMNTRDIKVIAIVGITAITLVRTIMGQDGAFAVSMAGLIGGIAGYSIKAKVAK